jgi:D-glycero-alpha-D-manno-heptose-7-phosphate kinase
VIITRTPFRISFFGGGTDYPDWYREHGGAVLATAINKYCYITCRQLPPFFEHKHRIVYSHIENVKNIDEIQHPAARAVLNWSKVEEGIEIHHDGDLPARSGLGSSSSFTVGLLNALHGIKGQIASKECLALNAIHIEQNIIQENVGSQDQITAAFGGFNRIEFLRNDTFDVAPIILPKYRRKELHDHLMLCFTGFSRIASEVAKSKIKNLQKCEKELKIMLSMVDEAIAILQDENEPIESFGKLIGKLINDSWQLKRSLSDRISTPEIDAIYESAIAAGAIGGKILGAGGGGFLLLFAKPERHAYIREQLKKLIHVPFDFEDSGSRVVLYQPNGL